MGEVVDWLMNGPAYVKYRTMVDILKERDESSLLSAKDTMLRDPLIQELLYEVKGWPWEPLAKHNDAKHPLHKLVFLSELGKMDALEEVLVSILSNVSDEGPPQIYTKLYKRWMGRDGEEYLWILCDAPLLLYALALQGYSDDTRMRKGVDFLASQVRENGWRCIASRELGNFRGPGPKESICPYSTLLMMRLLATQERYLDSKPARLGAESLLQRWEYKGREKPFLFGVGSDFKKLKSPLIWYDILHVTDVLSHFPFVRRDERFEEMVNIVRSKNINGRYTPESIWMAWKQWDFGQKKEPSYWLTFMVQRMLNRI
ncbi:MAG: hypothetical protein ACMUIE_02660 [Thermoplasmatota archaeon]